MQQGQEAGTSWTQELNQDSLITDAGSNYLDTFAGLGNDFDTFDAVAQHHAHSGLDTPMSRLAFGQDEQLHVQALEMHRQRLMSSMDVSMADLARMAYPQLPSNEPVQGYSQYPLYSQISHPCQQQVPLTPISTEMQATQYKPVMESVGQMIFDRQNASFTPLVSPAQTPVENAWNMPEYVMADEFFSPLTSPAIEAQQQQYTPTNATSPPVEFTRDASLSDRLGAVRKSRRKLTPTSRTSAPRSVRQSPATKPLTRRRQPNEAVPENGDYASASQLPSSNAGIGIGSDDSVSPEAFSEMLMRPPPVPSSRLSAATVSSNSQDENAPVTPATLMKMPAKQTVSEQSPALPAPMEDIALPAAMTSGPQILPQLDTKVGNDSPDSTPVVSAKTPKLSVDSTPRSTAIKTINASTEDLSRIARGGRLGKKRQSISSAAISPALRPKISPSISPLVPSSSRFLCRCIMSSCTNKALSQRHPHIVRRIKHAVFGIQVQLPEHN